jgi:two-component system sensor histidine kinase PilS (NtrC family)
MTTAAPAPPKPRTWFGAFSASRPAVPAEEADTEIFARIWLGFMSARVLVVLAVLISHLVSSSMRSTPVWLLALYLTYLAITALVRLCARPHGPGRPFDAQWLYTVGVDLAFIAALQFEQITNINYTPLLALPVLMAAIMASRKMALGTAALAALILLGHAIWNAYAADWENTSDIVQASLVGIGLMVLSQLINRLSARLTHEQAKVRRSRTEVQIQSLVNNLVIEALPDGVLVVDASYTVRAANPAAHLMLAVNREITPDRFNLQDNPAWVQLAHVARLTFADGPIDAVEVTLHLDDHHSNHLRARTERTPSVDDSVGSLCVMFLQDLREMEARLRTEKLASMGRMSAAVAHEIRNPLAAISQANDLLAEDLTAPTQQRLTAMVRENAQRLGSIVEDVLNVVRVQGTTDAPEKHALSLDEQVQVFCGEWLEQRRDVGARLHIDLRAPDIHVQFAREHLRRLLVNLLDNAARHASPKASAIQVSTHAVRHGPVMLMVWSDSPVIDASVHRHMFEPFFSSQSRSSGLGLFICRELCQRHGATINHERTQREQNGAIIEGNEFFVSFRRAHGPNSILPPEETLRP